MPSIYKCKWYVIRHATCLVESIIPQGPSSILGGETAESPIDYNTGRTY